MRALLALGFSGRMLGRIRNPPFSESLSRCQPSPELLQRVAQQERQVPRTGVAVRSDLVATRKPVCDDPRL